MTPRPHDSAQDGAHLLASVAGLLDAIDACKRERQAVREARARLAAAHARKRAARRPSAQG